MGIPGMFLDGKKDRDEWVSLYDLYGRVDGGRLWIKIGQYEGNHDRTTEKANYIMADCSGIRFRYLRIVPVRYHNAASMKVAVFVEADKPRDHKKTIDLVIGTAHASAA